MQFRSYRKENQGFLRFSIWSVAYTNFKMDYSVTDSSISKVAQASAKIASLRNPRGREV